MVGPVEFTQEDLLRAARPADPDPGASPGDDGDMGDLLSSIRQFNLEVQQTMKQLQDLLSLASSLRGGSLPFMGGGSMGGSPHAQPAAAPATPPPSPPGGADPKAQVLAGLEQIRSEVGDVTLLELVNILAKQYGGLRLSDIISRIK